MNVLYLITVLSSFCLKTTCNFHLSSIHLTPQCTLLARSQYLISVATAVKGISIFMGPFRYQDYVLYNEDGEVSTIAIPDWFLAYKLSGADNDSPWSRCASSMIQQETKFPRMTMNSNKRHQKDSMRYVHEHLGSIQCPQNSSSSHTSSPWPPSCKQIQAARRIARTSIQFCKPSDCRSARSAY